MLKLKNISKSFFKGTPDEHKVFENLNFTLNDGEFVLVIGSNGAGKSTLFNAISGAFPLDSGHIILDSKDITYLKETKRAKLIARIFQEPMVGTAPNLTIEENLALAYSRSKKHLFSMAVSTKERELFKQKLSSLSMGLEDRLTTKIGLLSGGQRQAVTLLMSTIVTPKVLLLDEHTAALDPVTAEKILDITQNVVDENKISTMMITHNISSALKLGTRTIMLENGKIVLDLKGEERKKLDVASLMELYREKCNKNLDNDRMLLQK